MTQSASLTDAETNPKALTGLFSGHVRRPARRRDAELAFNTTIRKQQDRLSGQPRRLFNLRQRNALRGLSQEGADRAMVLVMFRLRRIARLSLCVLMMLAAKRATDRLRLVGRDVTLFCATPTFLMQMDCFSDKQHSQTENREDTTAEKQA